MSTRVYEGSGYTAEEIAEAQAELNFHPASSPYWESRSGQDHLAVIQALDLKPKYTEAQMRETYRRARAQAEWEDGF